MNKYLFTIVALFGTICLSSCHNSKEDRVKDAFHDYVRENFDDPNSIVEIVRIDCIDTLSIREDKNRARNFYNLFKKSEFENDSVKHAVFNFMKTHPGSLRGMNDALKLSMAAIEICGQRVDLANKGELHYEELDDDYKALSSCKDTTAYLMSIKYRVKDGRNLKMEKIECICDTTFRNISFLKDSNNNIWTSYIDKVQEFAQKYETEFYLNIRELSLNTEVARIIEKRFGIKIIK
jgi:hypothetical protein